MALGASQPLIRLATRAPSPRVKWPEREASNSYSYSAEVKNAKSVSVFLQSSDQLRYITSNDGMMDELKRICKETRVI
jgi:hypothetical protein